MLWDLVGSKEPVIKFDYCQSSGRPDAGVGAVEKQTNNKKDGHAAGCCNQPEGQNTLSPAGPPGHSWPTIRKAIGDSTVGIQRLLAAHRSGLS